MLKKSLLLTSCLMVGVALSSASYAGTGSTEAAIEKPKTPPRKASKTPSRRGSSAKDKLPKDASQPSILAYVNPTRLWFLERDAEGEEFENANKRAYAKLKQEERKDAGQ